MEILQILLAIGWTVVGLVVWGLVLIWIGRSFEEPVLTWFDRRWLPSLKWKIGAGARLELVIRPDKGATTYWRTAKAALELIGYGIIAGFSLVVIDVFYQFFQNPIRSLSFHWFLIFLGIVAVTTILPLEYWVFEWIRRAQKFIVFTDNAFLIWARPSFLGLLIWGAKNVYVSFGPSTLIEEIKQATDVEFLSQKIKTSWFYDQWISRLAHLRGVGSIYLPTRILGAADLVIAVPYAWGLVRIFTQIAKLAKERAGLREEAGKAISKAAIGESDKPAWSTFAVDEAVQTLKGRLTELQPEGEEVDLFVVEDPGFWNPVTGLPNEQVEEQRPTGTGSLYPTVESSGPSDSVPVATDVVPAEAVSPAPSEAPVSEPASETPATPSWSLEDIVPTPERRRTAEVFNGLKEDLERDLGVREIKRIRKELKLFDPDLKEIFLKYGISPSDVLLCAQHGMTREQILDRWPI